MKYILCVLGFFLACGTSFAELPPSSFDLRDINGHSYIGPVRDQGACGSCYSFGALAAAESVYNRYHGLYDTAAVDFSESFIIWSLSPLYEGFDGCNGASYDYEELTGLVEHGVPPEADFPYVTTDPGPDNHHWDAPRTDFNEWYRIPPNDIETTKRIIRRFGAVDAAVFVDGAFQAYPGGIFQNTDTSANRILPYYSSSNHAASLVGWEDDPGDGGMGYWILRNSWGTTWGEDGYMRIRYTSARASMEGTYLVYGAWGGEDVSWENAGEIQAVPWSAGRTTNAHAVDIWTGAGSTVTNTGTLSATAAADADLATARGVYLWGGPQGGVTNQGLIHSTASSLQNQAIAYGICAQAHEVRNAGQIFASASAANDQALAYGILLFNGGSEVDLQNNGQITAGAEGVNARAYGVWTDSRSHSNVVNNGRILANASSTSATGVLLSGGPASVTNTGRIEAAASAGYAYGISSYTGGTIVNSGSISSTSSSAPALGLYLDSGSGPVSVTNTGRIEATTSTGWASGIEVVGADATIVNSGSILVSAPDPYSIYANNSQMRLILRTGSDLSGVVCLWGVDDYVELQGTGTEDEIFVDVETLEMNGEDWSLTGSSAFDSIGIQQGRLRINGAISGPTTVEAAGTLGGSGTLTGNVLNKGMVAAGNSIGTLTITGDYTHTAGAVLESELGGGASDLLAVTGTADIQGGTLQVVPYGYATAGDYTFLTAGTVQGAFDQVETPAVLNAALSSPTPNTLSLNITRNTYQSLATDQDQSGLGNTMDKVRPSATGDMASVLNQVDTMSVGGVRHAMDALMPKLNAAASTVALGNVHMNMNYIRIRGGNLRSYKNATTGQTRIKEVKLASADDTMSFMEFMEEPQGNNKAGEASLTSNYAMWLNTLGSYTKYGKTSESPAFREKVLGFMLGLEYRINDSLRGGVAGAFTQARLDEIGSRSMSENDSYRGLLYALWDDAEKAGGYYAETVLGFGQNRFDSERSIAFLGRTAFSKHDGQDYFVSINAGHDWTIDRWTFGPTVGVEYVYLHEEGYEEHGAIAADLKIDSCNSDSMQSLLGFHVTRSFRLEKSVLIAELRARWDHDYLADSESLSCRFTAAGPSFDISGRDTAGDSLLLGASLKSSFRKNITGFLDYDCMLQGSDGYKSHIFNVGLKILF
ncbi:MAG: autotransporter domain-containing protein [Deltaproteobacteria bacterium]|nr:autotransporter domain-containing protein [Deltaproteobacteria bacterium]